VAVGPACWAAGAGERRERIGLSPKIEGFLFSLFLNFVFILFPKFFCKFEICLKFQTFPNI
jgi:hypothetical protein